MTSSKMWVFALFVIAMGVLGFLGFSEPPAPVFTVDQNLCIPTQQGELAIGLPDAAHELRIFFAPTCAHCVEYHREVMPILVERFITRGVVRIIPLLFARHAVDMYLMKIFLCRGDYQMYPAFLVWLVQLDQWVPIFTEMDANQQKANLKYLLQQACKHTKINEMEIINALKINTEMPEYRHYVAMYALLNGYRLEEIVMALDNDKLEKQILSMKLKAVDDEGKLVQLIPAAYWDGKYVEGVPGADEIDKLIMKSHEESNKKATEEAEVKSEEFSLPTQPLQEVKEKE